MFEIIDEAKKSGARILVVGVGGGGCNAVNTMIRSGLSGVEYVVCNTDAQALNISLAPTKVQLGNELTKGLGAGANPEVGKKAALDAYDKISEILTGADMVFVTAGMGGGTGTGAAPVIAKLAKELGALTVGVVTKPFNFEGKKRSKQAVDGIQSLASSVDSLITIPNQRLLYLAGETLSLVDTFKKADEVLLNAVQGISDLINNTGHINADFADVCTVMRNKGMALMGTGVCSGPDRAIKAATQAISSPLLEDISIDGATGIIINITGNSQLTMHETNEAVSLIMEAADEDAEIIFGTVIDENLNDEVKVTVIATGLGSEKVASKSSTDVAMENVVKPAQTFNMNAVSEAAWGTTSQSTTREARVQAEEVFATSSNENQEIAWTSNRVSTDEAPARRVESESHTTQARPNLSQTIREAANRYEAQKQAYPSTRESLNDFLKEDSNNENHSFAQSNQTSNGRAKSLAEKLGFMNFDEDEFDKPSYLRKDNQDSI